MLSIQTCLRNSTDPAPVTNRLARSEPAAAATATTSRISEPSTAHLRRPASKRRPTTIAESATAMTKPAMPERDSVITSETDINATAMSTSCTAPPSRDDSQSTALRHPAAGRRVARAIQPSPSPIARGRPISIQPA